MKISIVVPVYNTEKYIARCLSSLVEQTYRDLEIIVVDDGSTDESLKIAKTYAKNDARVKVLARKHAGTNLARKKGIENASGDYFMFIDSDDWVEYDTVEKLVGILHQKKYDIIKFNAVDEPSGYKVPGIDLKGGLSKEFNMVDIKQKALETKLLRSLAYEIINAEIVVGAKSFERAMSYGEDYLANLEIIDNASSFLAIDDVFYHYRRDTLSSTTTAQDKMTILKNFEDTKKVCMDMVSYAKKWGIVDNSNLAFIVLDTYRNSICRLLGIEQITRKEFLSLTNSISDMLAKVHAMLSSFKLFRVLFRQPLAYQMKHSSEVIHIFNGDYNKLWARKRFYQRNNNYICKYMRGRLGNQLFQYAAIRQIQEINGNRDHLRLNFSKYIYSKGFNDELTNFNVKPYKEIERIYFTPRQFIKILYYKVKKRMYRFIHSDSYLAFRAELENRTSKSLQKTGIYWKEDGKLVIRPTDKKHKIAIGHFEFSANFDKIRPQLLEEITPKRPPLKKNQSLYNIIESTNSVCVSIRRGDFVSNSEFAKKFNVCDQKYFKQATKEIKKRVDDPVFVIFSDDIEWCRNNLKISGKVYYEDGTDPVWEKLRLMYSCKHFIISNSTFSWWAQYLSRNNEKIVIAPLVWQKNGYYEDIYDKNWILVDNGGEND